MIDQLKEPLNELMRRTSSCDNDSVMPSLLGDVLRCQGFKIHPVLRQKRTFRLDGVRELFLIRLASAS